MEIKQWGWLAPDGEFIECDPRDHWLVASDLTEARGIDRADQSSSDILIVHGWIQISYLTLIGHGYIFMSNYKKATDNQKQFLREFIENHREYIAETGWYDLYDLGVIDEEERRMNTKEKDLWIPKEF